MCALTCTAEEDPARRRFAAPEASRRARRTGRAVCARGAWRLGPGGVSGAGCGLAGGTRAITPACRADGPCAGVAASHAGVTASASVTNNIPVSSLTRGELLAVILSEATRRRSLANILGEASAAGDRSVQRARAADRPRRSGSCLPKAASAGLMLRVSRRCQSLGAELPTRAVAAAGACDTLFWRPARV